MTECTILEFKTKTRTNVKTLPIHLGKMEEMLIFNALEEDYREFKSQSGLSLLDVDRLMEDEEVSMQDFFDLPPDTEYDEEAVWEAYFSFLFEIQKSDLDPYGLIASNPFKSFREW